ncbi:MAG: ATP-binding protein [Candidatus Parcubacteria bacterium]|nr:ATP-binding protein [Candidatus Parcubacteria bacterium]
MNNLLLEIIKKQKQLLDAELAREYIPRAIFVKMQELIETSLIKVIIGPRRSGKSILSLLLLKNKSFAFLNLDDESLVSLLKKTERYDDLLEAMFTVYGKTKILLFDEIQNLDRWELFANRLHREGYNLFLTGSNANLLSRELATHLTGRHYEIDVLPFSFSEYLLVKKFDSSKVIGAEAKGELLNYLQRYMISGGYPEVVINGLNPTNYLSALFDSVIFKDVISRYKLNLSQQKISDIGSYAINNITGEFSYNSLKYVTGIKTVATIEKYLRFLQESYILFILKRFSNKDKERIKSPKKFYVIDNGFIQAKAVRLSDDYGKLMENLVFVELLKHGFKPNIDLFYYKTRNNKEIDFLVRKGAKADTLIQVSYDISDSRVEEREVKALVEASGELNCDNLILINWEQEKTKTLNGSIIKYIPLWKWLLNKD